MQERQLHGVADLLDLRSQAADVLVGDVRHFLEDEVLHLGARDLFEGVAGAGIDREGVADPELLREQGAGEPDDAFLVRPADHQGTVRAQHFLQRDKVPGPFVAEPGDHQQRLVQEDLLADGQLVHVDQRADPDAHLPAGVENVHRFLGGGLAAVAGGGMAFRVQLQHGAEAVRRLALLVEGVLEPEDFRFRGFQHAHELGVVLRGGGELAVNMPEFVPEDIDLPLGHRQLAGGVRLPRGCCRVLCRRLARIGVRSLHRASAPSYASIKTLAPRSRTLLKTSEIRTTS